MNSAIQIPASPTTPGSDRTFSPVLPLLAALDRGRGPVEALRYE